MSAVDKTISSVIGAAGSIIGLGNTRAPTIQTAAPVNTDDALNQADELLRQRQRKGINANLLNGSAGAGAPSATSTGQKTLLGG